MPPDPPTSPKKIQMPSGALSPYGAEVAALLGYLDSRGAAGVQGDSWSAALAGYFTSTYPGYKNKSVKTLIANLEAGKKYPEAGDEADTQANMLCKVRLCAHACIGAARGVAVFTQQQARGRNQGGEAQHIDT
jgi:hypothetical protein